MQSATKDKKYDAYYSFVESGAKLYMDSQAKDLFRSNSFGYVTVDYTSLKGQNLVQDFTMSMLILINRMTDYGIDIILGILIRIV